MSEPMPESNRVFLPMVHSDEGAPSQKVAIDPITRIEGHLRLEVQIEDGYVRDAWSAGMMFRGIELLLQNRDPRDAWVLTQRI